jgi:hypothetical protein
VLPPTEFLLNIGVWFTSTERDIFSKQYSTKAAVALNVAHSSFWLEPFIGPLSVAQGQMLYMARVDPHLINGAEIAMDIHQDSIELLVNAQHTFIRNLLWVS